MERTRDRLLLALYALPDPPDGMLMHHRACAASNEQDEGSAENRALEVDAAASCGGVKPPSVDANRRMDPVGRKRMRTTGGAARDDGGGPRRVPDNNSLDATRKGRGTDKGGERFLNKYGRGHDAEEERVPDNYSLHASRKGGGADMAGERFFKKHRSGHDAEEEGGAHGRFLLRRQDDCLDDPVKKHGGGERFLNSRGMSTTAGERFLGAVNGAPCSRGVSTAAGERFLGAVNGAPCRRGVSTTAGERFLGAVNGVPCRRGVSTTAGVRFLGAVNGAHKYYRDHSHASSHSYRGEPVTRIGCGLEAAGTGSLKARVGCGLEAAGTGSLKAGSAKTTSHLGAAHLGAGAASQSTPVPSTSDSTAWYDPVPEILFCSGEVLSKPWQQIWQHTPLILHDKRLAQCLVVLGAASTGVVLNLTKQITNILEKHHGDVSYFRLDSTCWTGGKSKLSEWMKRLSDKNASEIIIVNREDSTSLEFPLEDMQSPRLRSLRLAFFCLSDLDINCFDYSSLSTLELIGCSFATSKLYHVVKDCSNLTHLGIGLTTNDVQISSQSLQYIQIWKCNIRHLCIESAPKLQKMISGVYPMWKKSPVLVMIRDTPSLQKFENLLLPIHKVEDKLWMRSLTKISLGIQMAHPSQRQQLCDYLQNTTSLQELELWRMDEVAVLEELEVAVDNSLIKLNTELLCFYSLQTVVMEGFRGGSAEVSILSAILKSATCLIELRVKPCPTSDKDAIVKAFLAVRSIKRASTKCLVKFVGL